MALTPPPPLLSYWDVLKRNKNLTDIERKTLYCQYMKNVEKSRPIYNSSSNDDSLAGVGILALANLFGFLGD